MERRRILGCGFALVAVLAVPGIFWSAGGFDGLMVATGGRNPWHYVAPTRKRRAETLANAEEIIAALERWRQRNSEYPKSLDELVPSELGVLPPSTIGDRKWNYRRVDPRGFVLDFFEGPIYEHSWWDSRKAQWEGDH